MANERKKKVVQTELELEDYKTLLSVAKSKSMTLKEAAKEALRSWTVGAADLKHDPLFKLKPVEFKIKVRTNEIDDFLYKRRTRR